MNGNRVKRSGILLLLVCMTAGLHAQHRTGTLSFQLGYDGAVHATRAESIFAGLLLDTDTSAAVTTMFSATAQYNLLNWLSTGLTFSSGSYLEDTADVEANGNSVWFVAWDTRLYPVNREKFNLYFGADLGLTRLEINRVSIAPANDYQYHYNGMHLGVFTGFNWYIFNVAGLFLQLGYAQHNFNLDHYSIDDVEQSMTNWNVNLDTYGANIRAGINVAINK